MNSGQRLQLASKRPTEFIDVTPKLREAVAGAGLRTGRIHLQSLHTTLGLAVNENEALLLADLEAMLKRLVPSDGPYLHDDFTVRTGIREDEPINGHAHCRTVLLQPALTILVEEGRPVLGRWQSVFAVELDGPRAREVALQLEGEFSTTAPSGIRRLLELELERQLLADPEPVSQPMRRLVAAGGKRVRPLLVLLTAQLGPKSDLLRSATLAAAVELIHTATLVHDDYVDESPRRRGAATVAAQEGPARAIAVGDFYFAKATRLIAELDEPAVTRTIAAALEAICRSQIDDVELRGAYPGDEDSYLRVVRGKTAALMAAACTAGAQLAGAPLEKVERLRRYGELMGVAFQMADDVVDFSESSGKPLGQDVRERVLSLPLIYATEDRSSGPEIRRLLAGPLPDEDLKKVVELVAVSGALERVNGEARGLVEAAVRELEGTELDGVREELVEIAQAVVGRDA